MEPCRADCRPLLRAQAVEGERPMGHWVLLYVLSTLRRASADGPQATVGDVSARQALILLVPKNQIAAPSRADRQTTSVPSWGKRPRQGQPDFGRATPAERLHALRY